jgi:peptidoglycan hydrolase-like protein with peptidoglycan-binding domain
VKTSTKFVLAAASISIFSFGGQMQNVYAKPQTPVTAMPNSSTKIAVLKVGSKGSAVNQAQKILKQEGFYKGPINGIFSPQMEAAVKAFQKSEGIKVTGVIGPETQAAFN